MESEKPAPPPAKPEPFFPNIGFNVLLPVIILGQGNRFTENAALVLVLALACPVIYFFYDLKTRQKKNFISIIGFVSVLLTGGVGLLELPRFWFIVKETAIPGLIGLVVLGSLFTRYPLIRVLLFSRQLFDVDQIQAHLVARQTEKTFDRMLTYSTVFLAGSFFFSAVLNFIVASHFIQTEPRDNPVQFNIEVGAMTGWSYLIIALPSMVLMMAIFFYLIRGLRQCTGLAMEDCLAPEHRQK